MQAAVERMAERVVRIIVNGATGRLGTNQHLTRALLAIREGGGIDAADGSRIIPEPVLVGRNPAKLSSLANRLKVKLWTTDLDQALADPVNEIFFDTGMTGERSQVVARAIEANKDIYCEKPLSGTLDEAMALVAGVRSKGLHNGIVQDKLFLPGLSKLALLLRTGFFGELFHVHLNFGWWVFSGENQPAQRSSWNYRKSEGGGLILDMFPHWHYIVQNLFGRIAAVNCRHRTHVAKRWDEQGRPYDVDVEDGAYASFELENGLLVDLTSSWTTRVRGDDLLTVKVDGENGSAIAGLHRCHIQPAASCPKPVYDPDVDLGVDYRTGWQEVPTTLPVRNSFRQGWELYLKSWADRTAFPYGIIEGARALQLIDGAYRSHRERRWIDLLELDHAGVRMAGPLAAANR